MVTKKEYKGMLWDMRIFYSLTPETITKMNSIAKVYTNKKLRFMHYSTQILFK